jgi:hypothetical protein
MAARLQRLAVVLSGLLAVSGCEDQDQQPCCPDGFNMRCAWNLETMQYDRACSYTCRYVRDGGDSDAAAPYGGSGRNTIAGPYDKPPPLCRD